MKSRSFKSNEHAISTGKTNANIFNNAIFHNSIHPIRSKHGQNGYYHAYIAYTIHFIGHAHSSTPFSTTMFRLQLSYNRFRLQPIWIYCCCPYSCTFERAEKMVVDHKPFVNVLGILPPLYCFIDYHS